MDEPNNKKRRGRYRIVRSQEVSATDMVPISTQLLSALEQDGAFTGEILPVFDKNGDRANAKDYVLTHPAFDEISDDDILPLYQNLYSGGHDGTPVELGKMVRIKDELADEERKI